MIIVSIVIYVVVGHLLFTVIFKCYECYEYSILYLLLCFNLEFLFDLCNEQGRLKYSHFIVFLRLSVFIDSCQYIKMREFLRSDDSKQP